MLVFDLMDTVVRDPFFADIPAIFGDRLKEAALHRNPDGWPDFERGRLSEEDFFANFYEPGAPSTLIPVQELKAAIVSRYAFVAEMEGLLSALRAAKQRLWVLSNYPSWFEDLRQTLGLDRFFDHYSISYRTGFRKPEVEAYQQVCTASGKAPEGLLLVDDRYENCVAARKQGWRVHHFESAAGLRSDLVAQDLL